MGKRLTEVGLLVQVGPTPARRSPIRLRRWTAVVATVLLAVVLVWGAAGADEAEGDGAPELPLNLESATPSSLAVTWDEVEGAALYTIQWRRFEQFPQGPSYAATGGRYRITGLLAGRLYVVRVLVSGGNGAILAILRGNFRTPLTAPQELSLTAASASSLSVSWSQPAGWTAAGYRLRWRKPSDDQFLGSVELAGSATSYELTGLEDQTEYAINLLALNGQGAQSPAARLTAYAVDPLTLTLTSSGAVCTANTLTELSWKITGGLLPHRLFIGDKKIDLATVQSHRVNCGPLALDEQTGAPLAEQSKTFSALARDKRGVRASAETMVELVAQGAPSLSARTAASGAVALNWSIERATGVTHWEYRQRRDEGQWGAWTKIAGSTGATTDHTVSGLTADARYSFRLRATSGSVAGPRSGTASAVAGLTSTVSSERETLRYDNLQSTEGATSAGPYSFLRDASDFTSGATTFAEVSAAVALLVNNTGYRGRDYTSILATVQVGDRITWFPYSNCWYHFRVTGTADTSARPSRTLFTITHETADACGATVTQRASASYFDEARGNVAAVSWLDAPSVPRVGPDGIRVLPNGYTVEGGHTYRLQGLARPTAIVMYVPTGMRLRLVGRAWASDGRS